MSSENYDRSRRDFLRLAALFAGGLAAGCWPNKAEPIKPVVSEKSEYQKVLEAIQGLGYKINEKFSHEGSGRLVVFLPEFHGFDPQARKDEIANLDRAIAFDYLGLEGLAGAVDSEKCWVASQSESFFKKNVILEQDDHTLNESDSPWISLQKAGYQCESALKEFSKGKKGGMSLFNFESELFSALRQTLPTKGRQFAFIPPLNYEFIKNFHDSEPRVGAPGLAYFSLETRAKKFGIETAELDRAAIDLANAWRIQSNFETYQKGRDDVQRAFESLKKERSGQEKFSQLESAFGQLAGFMDNYLDRMEKLRDGLLSNSYIAAPLREGILAGDKKVTEHPDWKKIVETDRSRAWIENLPGEKVLLVGGSGHNESVCQAALDKGYSIITLKK